VNNSGSRLVGRSLTTVTPEQGRVIGGVITPAQVGVIGHVN